MERHIRGDFGDGPVVEARQVELVEDGVGDPAAGVDYLAGEPDQRVHPCVHRATRVVDRTDPWPFEPAAYRDRNKVERLFAKLKQFRRVATRYDKLKVTYLGMGHQALGFIRLRWRANVNTA